MMTYIIYILAGLFSLSGFFGFFYSGPKKFWVVLASCIYMGAGAIAFQTLSFWPLVIGFTINMFLKFSGLEPTEAEVAYGTEQHKQKHGELK